MPAWLRFLESRGLIDAGTSKKVAAELCPCTPRCYESGSSSPKIRSCIAKDRRGRPCRSRWTIFNA